MADGRLDAFISRASHDLRAPIRHIRLLADWLTEDHAAELSPAALEKLAGVDRCARRLEALVGGAVEYLRLDAAAPPQEPVDTARLVAEAIARVAPAAGMTVAVDGILPEFHGVPERMARVFTALIDNAVRHHDGATGTITVSGTAQAGECVFRVRDYGPGIAAEFRETVFEPFRTLRARDEAEGSGMALAIVQRIVEQHGGRIWVEDNPGARGACVVFTVRCPDGAGRSAPVHRSAGDQGS